MPRKYTQVPELMLGFDSETTGLSVMTDRAISYGFDAYRFGTPFWSEHYFVLPDCPISEGARRVHGLSVDDIEAKRPIQSVYNLGAGLTRAVRILRDFHQRGAFIVGSNIGRFDIEMLRHSCSSVLGTSFDDEEFDLSRLRIIDVVEHDLAIEPSREVRPRRGLEYLCAHYGVKPGEHDAFGDARAAVEVFLQQVMANNAGQAMFLFATNAGEFFA